MTVYYVDGTATGTGDGLSEVNAFTTIDTAMNNVVAGDKVWVKASGNYNELATIDTVGGISGNIVYEGYQTIPGDNGKATIDAQSTRASCIEDSTNLATYHVFKNFIFTNATADGVNYGNSSDHVAFANCEFNNCGAYGFQGDNNILFLNCEFSGSSTGATDCDNFAFFVGCIFNGDRPYGISSRFYYCLFYGITSGVATQSALDVVNCTFDHENTAAEILGGPSTDGIIINNIFYDNGGALDAVGNASTRSTQAFAGYNLFNSIGGNNYRTTDLTADPLIGYGDVTSTTLDFNDEAGDDYRLGQNSQALNAGLKPGGIT